MAVFILLCTATVSVGQTIDANGDCYTIGIPTDQTPSCGGTCPTQSDACNHCATFTFTNVSTNCDITSLKITSENGPPGSNSTASTCYQVCSPQGPPDVTGCQSGSKTFNGHYPPGGTNGLAQTFTICNSGSGVKYYKIEVTGSRWDVGGDDCICSSIAHVHF